MLQVTKPQQGKTAYAGRSPRLDLRSEISSEGEESPSEEEESRAGEERGDGADEAEQRSGGAGVSGTPLPPRVGAAPPATPPYHASRASASASVARAGNDKADAAAKRQVVLRKLSPHHEVFAQFRPYSNFSHELVLAMGRWLD